MSLILLVFVLARMTGDPALLYLHEDATRAQIQEFRELHGFNDPIPVQFARYLRDIAHLDFGMSIRRNMPAMDAVFLAFPWTLRLAGITVVLALLIAMTEIVWDAIKDNILKLKSDVEILLNT